VEHRQRHTAAASRASSLPRGVRRSRGQRRGSVGRVPDPRPEQGLFRRGPLTPTAAVGSVRLLVQARSEAMAASHTDPAHSPLPQPVGASLLAIAASSKAGGQQQLHREQARSHRECARSRTGARVLWKGSSDPDSGSGQWAAPGSGPVGSNGGLPHRSRAQSFAPARGSELARDSGIKQSGQPATAASRASSHTGNAPDPGPEPGFFGRGLLTPTAAVGSGRLLVQARSEAMAASHTDPAHSPVPLPVGASLLAIAASSKAGGQQQLHREQARSHRECARSRTGARVLWKGSSDPDSGGGQCAVPGSGPVGSNGGLPHRSRAQSFAPARGSELARDSGIKQSRQPATAASRASSLPPGMRPIRGRSPGSVGGVF
jgi:hypothetical protein